MRLLCDLDIKRGADLQKLRTVEQMLELGESEPNLSQRTESAVSAEVPTETGSIPMENKEEPFNIEITELSGQRHLLVCLFESDSVLLLLRKSAQLQYITLNYDKFM